MTNAASLGWLEASQLFGHDHTMVKITGGAWLFFAPQCSNMLGPLLHLTYHLNSWKVFYECTCASMFIRLFACYLSIIFSWLPLFQKNIDT